MTQTQNAASIDPMVVAADDLNRVGATVLRDVLPPEWVERMGRAVDAELAGASPTGAEYGRDGGRFYGDFFLWLRNDEFRQFAFDSPLPALAAKLMGSSRVNLFYDQLFVKEPGSVERTPWHQDLPYWPVTGEQVLSIWTPFDTVGPENGVVAYVAGSHRWGRVFRPQAFDEKNAVAFADSPYEAMPEISEKTHQLISWDLQPGDVLVHHGLTVHGAPGNSTSDRRRRALAVRYTGDDARYDPRAGTFMGMESVKQNIGGPDISPGDQMGGRLFPQVWPRL